MANKDIETVKSPLEMVKDETTIQLLEQIHSDNNYERFPLYRLGFNGFSKCGTCGNWLLVWED